MLTIRGVYDGKTIRPLPGEPLPKVEGEIEVQIVFLQPNPEMLRQWHEALGQLHRMREQMAPLQETIKDLIEADRVH
ncbi:hypothetical protein HRbin15_00459 [bacterium HR15]|uniref:Uncharacterized protein n=1 Tax=uncultured prokaryote TaxID=198431 RepID=H5S9J3_9ZZZZ|nr:hypothetical protein HGMM_F03C06C34 [uncultured prokaryote]GBC91998.1 hypothetical protein HRbin15_00459 [bacterium HR15]